MISNAQAFRQYLERREKAINANKVSEPGILDLYDEHTFYKAFLDDLPTAKKEVIIYSPFVSKFRTDCLRPSIEKLINRNIDVFIFTRPIGEYETIIQPQIKCALERLETLGVHVLFPGRYIHQKVAIIDREILWDGSLNIMSHRASNEMMRRTLDETCAAQVMSHIGINDQIASAYKLKYEKLYEGLKVKNGLSFKMKMKIFMLGLSIPILAWFVVSIVTVKPPHFTDLVINLINFLHSKS